MENEIIITGIVKAAGHVEGEECIVISIDRDGLKRSKFYIKDLFLPAEGEQLRLAGSWINKPIKITISAIEEQEEENAG